MYNQTLYNSHLKQYWPVRHPFQQTTFRSKDVISGKQQFSENTKLIIKNELDLPNWAHINSMNNFLFFKEGETQSYKDWVAAWKTHYNELAESIRTLKIMRRKTFYTKYLEDQDKELTQFHSSISYRLQELKELANNFLIARKTYKKVPKARVVSTG